jgi:hypothetical protein
MFPLAPDGGAVHKPSKLAVQLHVAVHVNDHDHDHDHVHVDVITDFRGAALRR